MRKAQAQPGTDAHWVGARTDHKHRAKCDRQAHRQDARHH
jgi:hypothetical protein